MSAKKSMLISASLLIAGAVNAVPFGQSPEAITAPASLLTSTRAAAQADARSAELTDQEYFSYSGVGILTCVVDGVTQTSTAFLVGSFDLAVTVAHTFERNGVTAAAADCVYTSTDSTGQIRERLPVAYYKSQWVEGNARGVPSKDLAVLRLEQRSTFAYRTLPLGKFSGAAAPVTLIGFSAQVDTDTFKRKSRGTVYERDQKRRLPVADIFSHDMNAVEIASGAPVLDERSGVIIGVHTSVGPSPLQATAEHAPVGRVPSTRNALITMDAWLETTLRTEIALSTPAESTDR